MKRLEIPILFIIDTSGSMDENMEMLNNSIKEMIGRFREESKIGIKFKVGIISFGDEATLHLPPSSLDKIEYKSLIAKGKTNFSSALKVGIETIEEKYEQTPIIVLLSDGFPDNDWRIGLDEFLKTKNIKKTQRIALGIGAGYAKSMLKKFISEDEYLFEARDSNEIYDFFQIIPEYIKN